MSRLAVFFPGIGYTVDKPLMHYSRRLAAGLGYDVKPLPYSGFPPKILGDANKKLASFEIALNQSLEMLSETDMSAYEDILFVGKSIGTIVGAFVIGVINDGMTMCGVSEFWQKIIRGVVIILAVVIDQTQRNLQAKMALQARNEAK